MMNNKLMDEVKQDIRSILLTAPKGMMMAKLCHEYRELIGRNLPVRELGYNSAELFLKNIPDTVSIEWVPRLDSLVLRAVANAQTSHIEKLVSKQKVSKQNNLPVSKKRTRLNRDTPRFNPPPMRSINSRNSNKSQPPRFQNTKIGGYNNNTFIPATVKLDIVRLVKEHEDGISLQQLPLAFQRRFGKDLKFDMLGFSSLHECLESISDLKLRDVMGHTQVYFQDPVKPISQNKRLVLTSRKIEPPVSSKVTQSLATNNIPPPINSPPQLVPQTSVESNSISLAGNKTPVHDQWDSSGISNVMKDNFRKILRNNPEGVWAAEFPYYYKELTGNELNLTELGYYSLIEMVNALPDVFRRARPPKCKSDWQLFDSSIPESSPSRNSRFHGLDTAANSRYVAEVITNVRKILQANPEGVYLDDFIHIYSLNCDSELFLEKLQCSSIEKFLLTFASSVPLKFDYSNVRKKVTYALYAEPTVVTKPVHAAYHKIPDDAILPGQSFRWQELPKTDENTVQIRIGTLIDPDLMWIQLDGENTSEALEKLMNDLDEFYTSAPGNKYIMRDHHVVINAICAGVWAVDGSWHRVSINGMGTTEDEVSVLFVDYGTTGKVKRTQLRYLRNSFMKLPAQAIKARMAFIKPLNGETYDVKVCDRLMGCTRNKVLHAEIVDVPSVDRVPIWVCDISKGELHLNKLLVDEGLVLYNEESTNNNASTASSMTNYTQESSVQAPPGNFPLSTASSSSVGEADLVHALSVLLQFLPSASTTLSEDFVEYILRSLNIRSQDGAPINAAVLYHLINSGMDLTAIVQMMGLTTDTPVSVTAPQNAGPQTRNVPPASFRGSPYIQNINPQAPMNYNSMNCHTTPSIPYPVENDTRTPVTIASQSASATNRKPATSVEVNHVERSNSLYYSSGDSDSTEVFEDDDEEFEQFCSEYSSRTTVERFVCRVELCNGYRFHIIVVEKVPYVSCGDISNLLWSNESSDYLHHRLRGKGVTLPSIVISDEGFPLIFRQLEIYNVKGIKGIGEKKISLYLLKNVIDILNLFGHPSPTIRAEIMSELRNFDPSDILWKHFSRLDINDSKEDEHIAETDTDKFHRMCIFDLKSAVESFRFKRLKIMNNLLVSPNSADLSEQLKKIERQHEIYEKRIKEIEALNLFC